MKDAFLKTTLAGLLTVALLAACTSQPVDERLAKEKPAEKPSTCIQSTASRIPQNKECANAPGRAYTKEDLDRSGGVTLAEKLRVLDPAIGGPR